MTKESFDKQDKSLMDALKDAREKQAPPVIMKNFSASVEAKIRERQPSLEIRFKPKRAWVPVWAPVFAVLVIGSVLVLRSPVGIREIPASPKIIELAQANAAQLSDEIAELRELGVWTDEDEKSSGVISESDMDDLEFSSADNVNSEIRLV